MENLIKLKCSDTTYVCNARPNSNFYKEDNLLIGTVNNNSKSFNLFKSVLRFYISDLTLTSTNNIYLYLFFKNMYNAHINPSIGISISATDREFSVSTINWTSCPKRNPLNKMDVNIAAESLGKYITINISKIIKSLNSYNNIYNLVIEPLNFNSSSVLQFSSNNSETPPYLILENDSDSSVISNISEDNLEFDNNTDCIEEDIDKEVENEEDDQIEELDDMDDIEEKKEVTGTYTNTLDDNEDFDIKEFSDEVINKLDNQNSRLDTLEESLSILANSFDTIINTINNNCINLDRKLDTDILPSLIKFDDNFSDINNNTTSLNHSIKKLVNQKDSSIDLLNNLTSYTSELIKSELSKLKTCLNNDILKIQSDNKNNINNLNTSIQNINETLTHLSAQLDSVNKLVQNITINPIDDKFI